ncbi:blue light receptor, partial [Pichia californica]
STIHSTSNTISNNNNYYNQYQSQFPSCFSAPSSSQRHSSTPQPFNSIPTLNLKHQSYPNNGSNITTSLNESNDLSSSSSSSILLSSTTKNSLSAPSSASNQNNFNFSRSSRFFPSPIFEPKNSLESSIQNNSINNINNIFNQSPLLSNNNNYNSRRTTAPSPTLIHSPNFLSTPNSACKIPPNSFDLNLRSNSTGYQNHLSQHLNFNYNNSSTPTPQNDSSNINYFDNNVISSSSSNNNNNNNLSYSTLIGNQNNKSSTISQQFTNISSTPIHSNLDSKSPYLIPSSNSHYNSSYQTIQFENINNSNILPSSSFVDKDLNINNLDFDINDLSDLNFLNNNSLNESPSPSPNSSPKKSSNDNNNNNNNQQQQISSKLKDTSKQKHKQNQNQKQKQKQILRDSSSINDNKVTYNSPSYMKHPIPSQSQNHSSISLSIPTPTLNLSNLKNKIPSIESPHTPLNQQNISQLLAINISNENDIIIDNDNKNVDNKEDNFIERHIDDNISFISPSSSNFPSPTLPTTSLFIENEIPINNLNDITTKSRILHYINHIITRHNITYKSYLISVPKNTTFNILSNLIETVFYPLGIIKSVKRIINDENDNNMNNNSSLPIIDASQFIRFRVIMSVADSNLTIYSTPNSFNVANNYSKHGKNNNNNNNNNDKEQNSQHSQQAQHLGPWKSIKYVLDGKDVKMLVFYEGETEVDDNYDIDNDFNQLNEKTFNNDILKSVKLNAKSSMSKSLTTNNKLDVCWYPEGFSSTFHRRGVNNFMFVRELQSKMIVNRTRVSGGGIVEMGEFRLSVPIEEI